MTIVKRVLFAVLLSGCVTARFQQFDASFDPRPAAKDPRMYDGPSLPPEYVMVGVIEIFHANTTDPVAILDRARSEGRDLGCELVMREPPPETEGVEVEVVVGGPPWGVGQSDEANRVRFLCAVAISR